MSEKKTDGGNTTTDNVEILELEGKDVEVQYGEDGNISVSNPSDLEGEELETWQKKAEPKIKLMAKAQKKGMENNQQKRELEKNWATLEAERKALEAEKAKLAMASEAKATSGDIKDILGVKTWDEVVEIQDTNPQKYYAAQTELARMAASQEQLKAQRAMQEGALERAIKSDGYDPAEVKAYAKTFLGSSFTQNAYEAYKAMHKKPSGSIANKIADIQKTQINFVTRGNAVTNKKTKAPDSPLARIKGNHRRIE